MHIPAYCYFWNRTRSFRCLFRRLCRRNKYLPVVVVILLLTLTLTGCSLLPVPRNAQTVDPANAGRLVVSAKLNGINANELTGSTATLIMSKDGRDRKQVLPIVDSAIAANIPDVLPGVWEITLSIADDKGVVTYQAESVASVTPGGTAALELVIRPLPGRLAVTVNPAAHPELANADRGRLYVNPGGYSSMYIDTNKLISGEKELAPGTYDFSIALFANSFYASDKLYESPYTTVTITPGRTTSVIWNPVTGVCTIGGRIDTPPAAPRNVELLKVAQGLAIAWQTVPTPENDIAMYRIYLRQNLLDKFKLVHEVNAVKNSYIYPDGELDKGSPVEVAVTAVDQSGQESERSAVVALGLY